MDAWVPHPSVYEAKGTWSADGRYIAFHSDRSGNFDIWVVEIPLINSN
ncbi:MAG: hypothetical protein HN534_03310 [Euryarchaeota archaeon]|nr:hypothetical protein [Euryarchaeota archaeon]MBT3653943.1 hypothetical protein [Euryarchaeota archaeon]MBT3758135.1 hypothetical protein [Euryarchaeota archaeon]MBT4051189.1 hypothetical protein [Euryarchaeota archaeon]MBT4346963.1 hypothetical protein [Euryarchaeota archaeon]